ncbi:unnamed protein product, partial [Ectocarpus sp. 12 AP-2014]
GRTDVAVLDDHLAGAGRDNTFTPMIVLGVRHNLVRHSYLTAAVVHVPPQWFLQSSCLGDRFCLLHILRVRQRPSSSMSAAASAAAPVAAAGAQLPVVGEAAEKRCRSNRNVRVPGCPNHNMLGMMLFY